MFGAAAQVVGLIVCAGAAGLLLGWLIWGARPRTDAAAPTSSTREVDELLSAGDRTELAPDEAPSGGLTDDRTSQIASNAPPPSATTPEPRGDGVVALARMERYFGAPSNEFVEPVSSKMASEPVTTQPVDIQSHAPQATIDDAPVIALPSPLDDLKRIRGLGPTSERRLHELGVRSFQELIDLEPEAFERVRRLLGKRNEQGSWVDQARALLSSEPLPAQNGSTPK